MVNETFDVGEQILELNFDLTKDPRSTSSLLRRSSSGIIAVDSKDKFLKKQQQQQQDHLNVSFETLPKSAENLSWKFFEQVSSVDNQLRNDESANVSDCQLMSMSRNSTTNDHAALNGHANEQTQTASTCTLNKSNGYMPGATLKISSQHSPDLIPSTTTRHATFQFTSPTATFKRKKQQQQIKQQQQQQQHQQETQQINNNYNSKNKNQLQVSYEHHHQHQNSAILCKSGGSDCIANQKSSYRLSLVEVPQQQQQQQQQQLGKRHNNITTANDVDNDDVDCNAAMISNNAGANTEATVTGIITSGTAHSFKTRCKLPAVSVETGKTGDDDVNDQITKPIRRKQARGARNRRARRKSVGSMGARLQHSADSFVDGIEQHFSLIGWRKKCLYTLLALLLILVVINLVLTLWILKVMEFTPDGMGLLKIVPGGIQLTGQAIVMDMLRASTIRSRHGQPLAFESSRNFSINTRDTNGMLKNHLFLGHDKLECFSTGFRINDTAGRNLFSVNQNEVTIGAHALRIDGEGGAIFRESIQTPHVRAEPGRELRLESPTRQLQMTAARDINLQSRAGGIELSALEDVKLSTLDGSLRFESTKILMPNLRTAQPPIPGTAQNRDHLHRVFQLCACSNGKLFLAAAHSICAGDDTSVCR